ncbi:hypothetical protein Tco_0588556 [Tanacetum coccineum]
MSTQQDIYVAGLLRYAKSRPNGKLIYNSIMNGPYVRRMIPKPGDPDRKVPVNETFHEQRDEELTEKELEQVEANDQAIQTILLGLLDIYAAVDSCKTAQEIWFTSTDEESIESYYYRFSKLINDFKRNKHFPEKIASNLKFLNNLQPEFSRHVTIVHQTKDLHKAYYTHLYDFLKYNQNEYVRPNVGNPVIQNVVQNLGVHIVGNQNGLIVVLGIANPNANQIGNGNVVAARAEGNGNGNNDLDLDEIEEVNANCILMANLQQASTSGTQTDNATVFSIWKAFGGNTRDLGSFGEETDKITNQHQDSSRFKVSEPGDGVTIYTRRRHTSSSDGVTTSLDGVSSHRLNSDLEDSTL